MLFMLLITLTVFSDPTLADSLEIRKITPPNLHAANIGRKIVAYRPMRKGSPALTLEVHGDKIILNNYGHGGSGWSLAPGSADFVANLLEQNQLGIAVNHEDAIVVLGAGTIGMFTALELINRGYTNITIIAEEYDNLTSHVAGGLLAPVSMDNNPELQATIDAIGINSYKFYKSVALKNNRQITSGARIVPAYFASREDSGLEPYVGMVMQPANDVLVDFQNGTQHKMVVYDDSIFMDTAKLMQLLHRTLQDNGVKFEHRKIFSFADLSQKIIFNCTGSGAKELLHDENLVAIQGHLIMLKDQDPHSLEYMMLVYLNDDKTKHNQEIMRMFCMFPKKDIQARDSDVGVIGGTLIAVENQSTPNLEQFDILLQNARRFYGINHLDINNKYVLEQLQFTQSRKASMCYGY